MNTSQTTSSQNSTPSVAPTTSRVSKAVYTIVEKPGKEAFWLRVGWAHVNRDGSYSVSLDAVPTNGKLHIRDWQPREDRDRPNNGAATNGGERLV